MTYNIDLDNITPAAAGPVYSRHTSGKKHVCEYTIPVEFRELPNSSNGFGERTTIVRTQPVTTKVTKLRCPCGEEIDR